MNDLPCIGFGITVVDPGPAPDVVNAKVFGRKRSSGVISHTFTYRLRDKPLRLLRAYVVSVEPRQRRDTVLQAHDTMIVEMVNDTAIQWKSGVRAGDVWASDVMTTWTHGHGPTARAALLAARAMR